MVSDSSTRPGSDDIDLAWDDEPTSPRATAQASSSARSAPAREAPVRSTAPRSVPPQKPTAKQSVRSEPPRAAAVKPPLNQHASEAPPQSTPRYSLRPVSVAPRPGASSPSSERPNDPAAGAQIARPAAPVLEPPRQELAVPPPAAATLAADVAPVTTPPAAIMPSNPVLEPPRQELAVPPPAAATLAADVAPVTTPPAAIMPSNSFEVLPSPASVPSEWPGAGSDTLRPNQMDAVPEASVAAFRPRRPWRALLAAGVVACVGLIWLVASSIASAPGTLAALPPTRLMAAASQAPAALLPAVIAPAPNSKATATATPAASNSSGLADSFKAALSDTPDTTHVTVRVSPSDAFVFKHGRRLGKGTVTVDVAPEAKITLVVQLDGYKARTVVLDGSNTSVNIVLNPIQANRALKTEGAPTGNAPSDSGNAPDNPY